MQQQIDIKGWGGREKKRTKNRSKVFVLDRYDLLGPCGKFEIPDLLTELIMTSGNII